MSDVDSDDFTGSEGESEVWQHCVRRLEYVVSKPAFFNVGGGRRRRRGRGG